MPFEVVFDSLNFLVVNKTEACSYHSDQGVGFFEKVKASHPSIISVHRLDKPTLGLCLFAKNSESAKEFGELFSSNLINKLYLAMSDRKPAKKQGCIVGDMRKSRNGSYALCKTKTNPATTQFFSHSLAPGKRLFILKPLTGKTHQLRVMMKSIGAPIIGDKRYKGSDANCLYLQAHRLEFTLESRRFVFTLDNFFEFESELFSEKSLADITWPEIKI